MGPGIGPNGGYGFPPPAAFFGSFAPTAAAAAGYPPHHVGRPAPFSPVYGPGMPYRAQGAQGGGRGGLEPRVASQESGLFGGRGGGQRYEYIFFFVGDFVGAVVCSV